MRMCTDEWVSNRKFRASSPVPIRLGQLSGRECRYDATRETSKGAGNRLVGMYVNETTSPFGITQFFLSPRSATKGDI